VLPLQKQNPKNWLKNWYPHPSQFQFLTKNW
jgi:hypothetical protein